MKLEMLSLKELLTLKECLDFLKSHYQVNYIIQNCKLSDDKTVKINKISKLSNDVIFEIEKKVLEYE